MSLKIEFNYEGEDYVLEYNREAIKFMEQKGFSLEKFSDAPATMMDIAFEALFFNVVNCPLSLTPLTKGVNGFKLL